MLLPIPPIPGYPEVSILKGKPFPALLPWLIQRENSGKKSSALLSTCLPYLSHSSSYAIVKTQKRLRHGACLGEFSVEGTHPPLFSRVSWPRQALPRTSRPQVSGFLACDSGQTQHRREGKKAYVGLISLNQLCWQ